MDTKKSFLFHNLDVEKCLASLESSAKGLSDKDIASRRKKYGYNELPESKAINPFLLFLKQFRSPLVFILIIAAVISWFAHHRIDTYVILFIVVVNAVIGFTQEFRAERAVASLKQMIKQSAIVLRNGNKKKIQARELVPGDIILVEEGDKIPADARLLKVNNLRVIEASLTGESVPISKHTDVLAEKTALADRKNMIWNGTYVAGGSAKAIVTSTGAETEIGKIAGSISEIKAEATHFQKKIKVLSKQMAVFAVGFSAILFGIGYFLRGFDLTEIFIFTLAAMVSAIPEGLPAILSILLAIGAYRMTRRNAIIREFTATETLGAINVIITDKTGTLTQNTLTVKSLWMYEKKELEITGIGWDPTGDFLIDNDKLSPVEDKQYYKLIQIASFSNNASVSYNDEKNKYEVTGDPTEAAMLVMAMKASEINDVEKLDDFPFNSRNKFRSSLVATNGGNELMIIGAPEKILQMSESVLSTNGEIKLTDDVYNEISEKINYWSSRALRVVALGYKKYDKNKIEENPESEKIVFAGLAGMIDPPRKEVKEAVLKCREAGIRVIMATGDHKKTAVAIAKEIGIIEPNESDSQIAYSESEIEKMDDQGFKKIISDTNVLARLTPDMKLKIASALQDKGFLIAMTGDGVNDAPALKKADVGIAMGIMGTDVAREAAQVVLADDNFATIVNAIEEGRIVFNNSRQASYLIISIQNWFAKQQMD